MFSKFQSIDQEKQTRILNAAMKEFSAKGFQAASTNEIARQATISKGLLFHYFTSKNDLYLYAWDYAVQVVSQGIHEKLDRSIGDFFIRLRQIAELKLEIFKRNPDVFEFLKSGYQENDSDIQSKLEQRMKMTSSLEWNSLFANMDTSRFKKRVKVEQAMNVMLWTFEGLGAQQREQARMSGEPLDIPAVMAELDEYLALFASSFLKK